MEQNQPRPTEEITHTPGPWRWLDRYTLMGDHGSRPIILTGCDMLARNDEYGNKLMPLDTSAPNARLIAAAPEVTAMLERLLDGILRLPEIPATLSPLDIEHARAAIAKAKGVAA